MTAILDEMRRIDAAHARGELTARQRDAAKAALVSDIEDAPALDTASTQEQEAKPTSPAMLDVVMFCIIAMGLCIGLATFLFGDLTLAITLAVTLLAAFTIRAFLALDK